MKENVKTKLPTNSPLIKIPFGGLTSNMLRTIAIALMLSDHIWATAMSFGNWMTYIGRMAFPIFAFQIAKNPNIKKIIGAPVLHHKIFSKINEKSQFYDKNGSNEILCATFYERIEQIKKLKSLGLEKLYIHTDGWGKDGYDNNHPYILPPCEEAGGWDGFKKFSEVCRELGYVFALHDQYRDYYYESPVFDKEKAVTNIDGTNPYCSKSQGNSISYRCSYSLRMGRKTQVIEIDLYEKGVQVQLDNGKIAIMVPLDSDIEKYNFTVTRIDEDNNETKVVSEKKDGYLIFYADHFSIFKITLIDESGEPTEDLSYSQCICDLNGHTCEETVVEATCTTEGYTKYTCSNCGYFYFDNLTSAKGHNYTRVSVDATCTQGGYDKYECTACGHTYTENETDVVGHDYEAVVTAPTCTTDGYTTYTCKACKHSYVADEIKSAGHDYKTTVVAPTCTQTGYTTYTCSVCEHSYVDDNVAATGHNLVDRFVESSCTDEGYTIHECTECDYSYVDSTTPENGHNYEKTVVPATCTTTGYTYNECVACGHAYVSDETPVSAHTPGDWVLNAEGKYVKICTGCNAVVETRVSDIAINGTINGHSSMVVNYKMSKPLDVTASVGKIIYTSADPGIATVDENGRVTGLKTGTTTITATIEGTNDSVTCEVKVEYTWWQWIIVILLFGWIWY